ncbi:isoprenylcysteine carboxylmethyltransferase family protein [Mesorhizobium sp. SB112]|uniref:methyltransferase family protein n=1 Tax=Mesorhizobium sp. SB112 TaxID=3151853 RepID=UPI003264479E
MADTATLHRSLGVTQLRRKTRIRLTMLLMLPLLVLTTGLVQPGSWPRELMEGVGVFLIFMAILGRAWCTLYIGGRKIRELVTTGPYSLVRNPLYFFSLVALTGLGAQTGSLIITSLFLVSAYVIFTAVVRQEESALRQIHGSQFDSYCSSVPRFVPNFRLWEEPTELRINPVRWRQTVLDALFFLPLVPLIRGIDWLQSAVAGLPLLQLP